MFSCFSKKTQPKSSSLINKYKPIIHLGIDHYNGKIAAYDENQKEIIYFSVISFAPKLLVQIDEIFQEIKTKFNDFQIGCVCFIFKEFDNNNTAENCKKIKDISKRYGCLKIEIINDRFSINYMHLTFSKAIKPKSWDIIWIFQGRSYEIWLKGINSQAATLIKRLISNSEFKTLKGLIKIKENSGMDRNPNYIFYNDEFYDPAIINDVFPECQPIFFDQELNILQICLLKARIMANDLEVVDYDAKINNPNLI